VIVPIDFNPQMAKPGDLIGKHYNAMVKKNKHLKEVFPAPSPPPPHLKCQIIVLLAGMVSQ
jgi:hypothetical protein